MARKTLIFTSLGLITLISFLFSIGLIIGYITGRHFSKKILQGTTRVRPLIFFIKNWKIHLHHWFLSVIVLICVVVSGYFLRFSGMVYGVLGGLILQDIYWDRKLYKKHYYWEEKWYKILSKR